MKIRNPIATCAGIIIGCQLATGCASTSSTDRSGPAWTSPGGMSAGGAPAQMPDGGTNTATGLNSISFTPTQKTSAFAPPSSLNQPGTRLIGIYGELGGSSPNAGSPFDGGSNLAQLSFATEGSCVDPDVDRTGAWLAFSSTMHRKTSDIYIKSVHGETLTQITSDPADDVMPSFSPDGKTIAFASNRSGNWDIYTTTIDGKQTVQITSDTDEELHPTWSPDGRKIAYCKLGSQSSRWEIWVVDLANTGVRDFLGYGVFPHWCPDVARNKILFQRARQRGSRDYSIWTVDYVDGQAMYPTEIASAANAALINPAWSSDGNRIVFVAVVDPELSGDERPAQSDLWLVNLDGTGRTSLTSGQFANFQPVWAGDGAVYFVSDRSGSDNVWAVTASRSQPVVKATGVASADTAIQNTDSHP